MNTKRISRRRKEAMKNKEIRDGFIEEHIRTGIPFQIRALREKEKWTQKQLGEKAEMAQERISVLEDPDYSKFTISTLLKVASAFDVGLTVRFVPFSRVVLDEDNLSETLVPNSYKEDELLHQTSEQSAELQNENVEFSEYSIKDPPDIGTFIAGIPLATIVYAGGYNDASLPSLREEAIQPQWTTSTNTISAHVRVC